MTWFVDKISQLFEKFIALEPSDWNRITTFAYVEVVYMYFDLKNDAKLREGIIGDDKRWNNKEWLVYSFMKLSPHLVMADALLGLNVPSSVYFYMGSMVVFVLLGKETLNAIVRHKFNVEDAKKPGE